MDKAPTWLIALMTVIVGPLSIFLLGYPWYALLFLPLTFLLALSCVRLAERVTDLICRKLDW